MLTRLNVKNLALIERAEIEFGPGLNVLTGETGAGKSIILGSINMCLAQKTEKDFLRDGEESGFSELVFDMLPENIIKRISDSGIDPDDGEIVIRRKLTPKRLESRINDETVTQGKLKNIASLLIDISGQNDSLSLKNEKSHLELLDSFSGKEVREKKEKTGKLYKQYTETASKLSAMNMDESQRLREMDFLQFEIDEINGASLKEGEEEELSENLHIYKNIREIFVSLEKTLSILENNDISEACREINRAAGYDKTLIDLKDALLDIEGISEDVKRDIRNYLDSNIYDEEKLKKDEERLDEIRSILHKYGGTVDNAKKILIEKEKRLSELSVYEKTKEDLQNELSETEAALLKESRELSSLRKKYAEIFIEKIKEEMSDLGFLKVDLRMNFSELSEFSADGIDRANFEISLNPGQPLKALKDHASGGELSRIMLSIRTVMAEGTVPTLIFDEIDTGISGRTAEMIARKLKKISKNTQVILITHLPQIASKADRHFLIEKKVDKGLTRTEIRCLNEEESIEEIGRMISAESLTSAVLENARELWEKGRQDFSC